MNTPVLLTPRYARGQEFLLAKDMPMNAPQAADAYDLDVTLRAYDPGLELGFSLTAGRWIVRHRSDDGRQTLVMRLEDAAGNYRPPYADVFEDVMKSNMRDDRNRRRMQKHMDGHEERERIAKEKAREEEREAMAESAHRIWVDEVNRRAPMHRTNRRQPWVPGR
ncbi:MAG: hypothetical protein RL272_802 [Candidatus Parcubacteria bacterium]|jgi:hypothetical protein